jgi:hypothetical protein
MLNTVTTLIKPRIKNTLGDKHMGVMATVLCLTPQETFQEKEDRHKEIGWAEYIISSFNT